MLARAIPSSKPGTPGPEVVVVVVIVVVVLVVDVVVVLVVEVIVVVVDVVVVVEVDVVVVATEGKVVVLESSGSRMLDSVWVVGCIRVAKELTVLDVDGSVPEKCSIRIWCVS